ncbi:MAG: hypothetical protein ACRD01_10290 [Terriglobales bacterium]
MTLQRTAILSLAGLLALALGGCQQRSAPDQAASADTAAARGAQLVLLGGCDDCHTPMLPSGEPDMNRRFSGVPQGSALPPSIPGVVTTLNLAWRGPWGLSEGRNITPDPTYGIGNWTQQQFLDSLRSGKDPAGHALLPPMPISNFAQLPDDDLVAIYNFLRTVKPSQNPVTGP